MKISDFDHATKIVLFRAKVCFMGGRTPSVADLERLKEAVDKWDQCHEEEICRNLLSGIDAIDTSIADTEEECDGCDGTGLMEGWNRRDGNSCPKCKGVGVVEKPAEIGR